MKVSDIAKCPTVQDNVHESMYRSFQILDKVKYWLREGMPTKLVLELIDEMEGKDETVSK